MRNCYRLPLLSLVAALCLASTGCGEDPTKTTPKATPQASAPAAPAAQPANPGQTTATGNAASQVPYAIDTRPMPQDDKATTIMPEVKGYRRTNSSSYAPQDGVTLHDVIYVPGTGDEHKDHIYLVVRVCQSPKAAQTIIKDFGSEGALSHEKLDAEPSYTRIPKTQKGTEHNAEFNWSRGRYAFSARADRDAKDLDAFMAVFPY